MGPWEHDDGIPHAVPGWQTAVVLLWLCHICLHRLAVALAEPPTLPTTSTELRTPCPTCWQAGTPPIDMLSCPPQLTGEHGIGVQRLGQ